MINYYDEGDNTTPTSTDEEVVSTPEITTEEVSTEESNGETTEASE